MAGSPLLESTIAARILAQALRDDKLVALIGAGASARSRDSNGREYPGLPTPSEFVEIASKQYAYVDATMGFVQACDTIFDHERRSGLEDALLRHYAVPNNFDLPPAHRILSWLPFSAYLCSNYDQFTERALDREGRRNHVVIDNRDIPRLKRGSTPIVKYHGCVSRPGSMVATTKDYELLDNERSLVRQLISVSLASRTLLVIGHGLGDSDLSRLLNDLLKHLNEYAPAIFVIREPTHSGRIPHFSYDHEVIREDLTHFLNRILHEYRQLGRHADAAFFDEAWLSSAFFAALRQAVVLPSETQVIDAFLGHLLEEFGARNEVESVIADATTAVEGALEERPNYTALRRTWAGLLDELTPVKGDVGEAEHVVSLFIEAREAKKALFRAAGRSNIAANERILLYSQSQRVVQTLLGASQAVQRTCEVFVGECRPKSPNAYQDAFAICQQLSETHYSVTVCPDVVAINLISSKQISKVIMGTHAIYVESGVPYAFVNTCGSLAIALAAKEYEIPLVVIGEALKVEEVPRDAADDHIYAHQENDLLEGLLGFTELTTKRDSISHTNIGYDLVYLNPQVEVLIPDAVASP